MRASVQPVVMAGMVMLGVVLDTIPLLVAAEPVTTADRSGHQDRVVRLVNRRATLGVALAGGGIVDFRLSGSTLNPLNWTIEGLEPIEAGKPYLRGHFLCLDRWGAPSEAEAKRGVPFHGEAPRLPWKLVRKPSDSDEFSYLKIACDLPLAGLTVTRKMVLARQGSVALVHEEVTNTRTLGRIYNMVQHPSIAAPFLDDSTVVDTNATLGFSQDDASPPQASEARAWPRMVLLGETVDLRRFRSNESDGVIHDVSSFVFDAKAKIGWVTAVNAQQELLLGYAWRTSEYPWLNIWRHRENGRIKSRGLEFGTTGLHKPYAALVNQGRILERPLYSHIDAGQTVSREYLMFVAAVPRDFGGVSSVEHEEKNSRIVIRERGRSKRRLVLRAELPGPPPLR